MACSKVAVGVGTLRGPRAWHPESQYHVLPLLSAVLNICYANLGTSICQDNRQGLCTWSAWGACSACAVCNAYLYSMLPCRDPHSCCRHVSQWSAVSLYLEYALACNVANISCT